MSSGIYGLEKVLKSFEIMEENLDMAVDEIAKETASMVHAEAVDNVSGPKNPNWKKYKTSKGNKSIPKYTKIQRIKKFLSNLKVADKNDIPYPVSVNTGTLRRSLKIRRLSKGQYKVFADLNIANYAYWVHEGTSKMKARPFLDDGVDKVLTEKKYLDIAADIVEKAIN